MNENEKKVLEESFEIEKDSFKTIDKLEETMGKSRTQFKKEEFKKFVDKTRKTQFVKYNHIQRLGTIENNELVKNLELDCSVEEKIDGGCGLFIDDLIRKEVIYGSRNRPLVNGLEDGQFKSNIDWIKNRIEKVKLNPNYLYYGEFVKKHTIKYDFDNLPKFIGFDIRIKPNGEEFKFLNRQEKEKEFKRINLPIVPLLWAGKVKDLDIDKLIGKSIFDPTVTMEGIVIKTNELNRFGRPIYAKVVREEFKEENKKVFGEGLTKTGACHTVEKYLTPARVNKEIHRLVYEENLELNRSLMKFLPINVCNNILNEEILEIFKSEKEIDFKNFKNLIAKKCLRYLDDFILLAGENCEIK